MARKKFQDLNLENAFLFAAVLEDEEICRLTLEMLLGEPVSKVRVQAERMLFYNSDSRTIRLDVYATDEQKHDYNVEMQGQNRGNLPKRSRYHQSQMDVTALEPGQDFRDLKPSCVIFICTFDPFGEGLYRYTFENRCLEVDIPLKDETRKVFFNTRGTNADDVPAQLLHFLRYVENSTGECMEESKDELITRIHHRVSDLKASREWEKKYMTLQEMLRDEKEEGYEAGLEAGRKAGLEAGLEAGARRILELMKRMQESSDAAQIPRLSQDEVFLQEMYEKYQV